MTEQIIEFVALERKISYNDSLDSFRFRKDRPAHWLQKICFFILRKLHAFSQEEAVTIERHVVDGRTFMDRLFKQQRALTREFNRRPGRLLIGAEDYANLMNEAVSNQVFSFRAEYGFGHNEILGLKVQVIPWMRGILVMPSDTREF